jgi:hypothetical protein
MITYKLTKKEKDKVRRINNSLKSNYVLAYVLLIYKKRKIKYASALRELRDKILLNFIQFIIFSEDESRPKKCRRIVSNTNNSENENFDNFNFVY